MPLSSTPLSLFLRSNIDLRKDGSVADVQTSNGSHYVTLVDKTGEAEGKMILQFRQTDFELLGWRQVDGRPITKAALAALIEQELTRELPDQSFLFAQPIEMRFNELLEGVRSDLAVKIIGPDYDVMEKLAAQAKAILDQVPGAGEVEFEAQGRAPVLEIILNREGLRRYNVHAADVNRTMRNAVADTCSSCGLDDDQKSELEAEFVLFLAELGE